VPGTLAAYFGRIALFLRSEIPSVMVGFATRKLPARSLLKPSIDHVYGDPAPQSLEIINLDEDELPQREDKSSYAEGGQDGTEPTGMQEIRECFSTGGETTLLENFERLKPESIVARRIVEFARSLLIHGASSGKKLKPRSLQCCVLTIGRRLGPLLEERDPAELGNRAKEAGLDSDKARVEILEELYVRAIENSAKDSKNPERLQGTVAWALREFHCFLVSKNLAGPVNESDVFRIPRGLPSVDAMIVTVEDIEKALLYLDYDAILSWSVEHREAAKMAILLGFFAGLRTMEGLGAEKGHFPGGSSLPFLVLPDKERDLKTPNAVRMIPVATFMEPFSEMVGFARSWTQSARKLVDKSGNDRLFGDTTDDILIPIIGGTLRAVTENDRLRFYSLRHSFASWTLTRFLLVSDLPAVPSLFPHLPLTTRWLQQSNLFRLALYGNDRVDNDHGWAAATLMGHAKPDVTFGIYCHTLDILSAEFLKNSRGLECVLSTRERVQRSGDQARSTAIGKLPGERKRANQHLGEDTRACGKPANGATQDGDNKPAIELGYALERLKKRFPNLRAEPVKTPEVCGSSWLVQTLGVLQMSVRPNRNVERESKYLGIGDDEVRRIVARNDEICCLQHAVTGQNLYSSDMVTLGVEGGMRRVPRVPGPAAIATVSQMVHKIQKLVLEDRNNVGRILDDWSRNCVPESGAAVFTIQPANLGRALPQRAISTRVNEYCKFLRALGTIQADLRLDGACGKRRKFAPTEWYARWGLRPRQWLQIENHYGKKAERTAHGQWLAIGPKRACPDQHDKYDFAYRDGFRFALLLASIRWGITP
jgi:integrase